jgi:hypothetical protein
MLTYADAATRSLPSPEQVESVLGVLNPAVREHIKARCNASQVC